MLNGTFLVYGMLSLDLWPCCKYADIGFSIGLAFFFFTAACDLSVKAAGKAMDQSKLGTVHLLRNQWDWVGGVGQMIMFYAKKVWFTNEM